MLEKNRTHQPTRLTRRAATALLVLSVATAIVGATSEPSRAQTAPLPQVTLRAGTYDAYARGFNGETLPGIRTVSLSFNGYWRLVTPDGTFYLRASGRCPGEYVTTNAGVTPTYLRFVERNRPTIGIYQYDVYYTNAAGKWLKSELWDRR